MRPVVLVTCMDARIDPALALGLVPGDAHVLRNAGKKKQRQAVGS